MVSYGVLFFAMRRSLWRAREFWIAVGTAVIVAGLLVLPFMRGRPRFDGDMVP